MRSLLVTLWLTLGAFLQPAYAEASPLYGIGPDRFVAKHWEGPNRFITTIIAAEREGYLLDYHALSRSLSPRLVGKDVLVGEGASALVYESLIKRLKVKQSDFVRFEININKAFLYDLKERKFVACLTEQDVLSDRHMEALKHMVEFQVDGVIAKGRAAQKCELPVIIGMSEKERMRILAQRAMEGVSPTRPIKLRGQLIKVEPTRSIPSVMGYRWVIGLSAELGREQNYANLQP